MEEEKRGKEEEKRRKRKRKRESLGPQRRRPSALSGAGEARHARLGVSYCKDLGDKMKCVVSVDRLGCGLHESC